MGLPRFHVDSLSAGELRLAGQEAVHALKARRLSVGDEVAVFDGMGHEAIARIESISRADVQLCVGKVQTIERPVPSLTLAVALPKGPRQDVLIEKCTELGVAIILPLITERSISSASDHKLDRWRRTAIEAAKQSGQAWLPEFMAPEPLQVATARVKTHEQAFVAATEEGPFDSAPPRFDGSVIAFVGPEGGWVPEELRTLSDAGCQRLSLGPNILRIETAAIALAALVHACQRPE